MPELQALRDAAHGAVRLDDLDERAGEFLSAVSNRLLSTVAGEPIRAKEGKVWLRAASVLTASPDEAEQARLDAVAEAPGGTGAFRRSTHLLVSLRVLIQSFLVASRLPPLDGAPPPAPSQPPPDALPAAPSSAAKKGKKREAPVAEVPVVPVARDSSAAAPRAKKPPLPRPIRKTGRSGPTAPPRDASPATSGAGFVVLQECLHTHPDAVPVVGHGQFPPSAPYYIVRIRVSTSSLTLRLLLTRCVSSVIAAS